MPPPLALAAGPALITGASSGIGAAFARRLAAQQHDLILTARRRELLEQLAEDLRQRHEVQVRVVSADLSSQEGIATVVESIGQQPLELLVNNAGFGVKGMFAQSDLARQLDMIQVHISATLQLCHAALPAMVAQRRGTIINVASVAAFFPMPGNANYAATKSHLVLFSEALNDELHGSGVTVQALCPGFTHSGFHDTAEYDDFQRSQVPPPLWLTADQVVSASLKAVRRKKPICIPGARYQVLCALARNNVVAPLLLKALRGKRRRSR